MTKITKTNDTVANKVIDPVCGMEVVPGATHLVALYQGQSYWFCVLDCRDAFEINPEKYTKRKSNKRMSIWSRYLAWLNRTPGGQALKCH